MRGLTAHPDGRVEVEVLPKHVSCAHLMPTTEEWVAYSGLTSILLAAVTC